jgi:cytochrome b subunit of formate dehydrogenase
VRPDLLAVAPPTGVTAPLLTLLSWVAWCAVCACITGLLMVAGRLMLAHRAGEADRSAQQLAWVLIALLAISSATAVVSTILSF